MIKKSEKDNAVRYRMKGERRAALLEIIDSQPFTSLHELEKAFPGVSSMTLRRDLDVFDEQGRIIKSRGGAKSMKFVMSAAEENFSERLRTNKGAKDLISRKAVEFIEPGRSIFFDSGTTMLRVAELLSDRRITVTTSGLNVALELMKKEHVMVNIVGGLVHRDNVTVSGNQASMFIDNINIDTAFICPSGVTAADGFTCGNYIHGELKAQVIKKAKRVIIVVDSSKLGKCLPYTFCGFEDVDVIICEDELPEDIKAEAEKHGIQTVLADD